MPGSGVQWTDELTRTAYSMAKKHGPRAAAAALSKRLGTTVTLAALYNRLFKAGFSLKSDKVAVVPPPPAPAAPEPEPDPLVVAHENHRETKAKRDLRRQHGALLDENQRLKLELAAVQELRGRAPEILVYKKAAQERSDAVACAIASDWHVEEPVIATDVHGLNEYNLDIAKERAQRFFRGLLRLTDMMARESKVTTIYLALLGDFFSGWIQDELVANTLLAPGDAGWFVHGLLISGIDFLLAESSYIIEADALPGNHGRLTEKMQFGDPTGTSLETVIYKAVADHYRNNRRVHIEVSDRAMVYRLFFERFNVRLIHGYEVKFQGGVGGITIPINKAIAQWDQAVRAYLTLMGHFHQRFDGGRFMVNGSLIGYNNYAQAIKAGFEGPQQSFFLVHARGGGEKSVVAPIWVDEKPPAAKAISSTSG